MSAHRCQRDKDRSPENYFGSAQLFAGKPPLLSC
jgi:hypothetical protein